MVGTHHGSLDKPSSTTVSRPSEHERIARWQRLSRYLAAASALVYPAGWPVPRAKASATRVRMTTHAINLLLSLTI